MHCVNLEAGMPTVDRARGLLMQALRSARTTKSPCVKFIHGYGSSGRGGAIRRDVRRVLAQQKKEGVIQDYILGEEFSPFDPAVQKLLIRCPEITRDPDYARGNDGVTIAVL